MSTTLVVIVAASVVISSFCSLMEASLYAVGDSFVGAP